MLSQFFLTASRKRSKRMVLNVMSVQTILKDLTSSSRQNPKAQYNLKLRQGFTLILSQRQTFFFLAFGVRKTQHVIMGSLWYLGILWYSMVTFSLSLFRRTSAFLRYFFFLRHMDKWQSRVSP